MFENQPPDFAGAGNFYTFFGVVEETGTDMLGRVKVRCFGYHPEDKSAVPTADLPWAIVLRSTTGWQMPKLEQGQMVAGYFADGRYAQWPVIWGIVTKVNRPSAPSTPGDGTVIPRQQPYAGQGQENPKQYPGTTLPNIPNPGAVTGDSKMMLSTDQMFQKYAPEHPELQGKGNHIQLATYQLLVAAEKASGTKVTVTPHGGSTGSHVGHSMHYIGRAFDITGANKSFIQAAVKVGFTGFGCYTTSESEGSSPFYHIDTGNARCWGPSLHFTSVPKWFLKWLTDAGWSEKSIAFAGATTNPGQPSSDPTSATPANSTVQTNPGSSTTTVSGAGTTGGSTTSWTPNYNMNPQTQSDAVARIQTYGAANGWSNAATGAYIAKTMQESSLDPSIVNKTSGAFGLNQWLSSDRVAGLNSYTQAVGAPRTSFDAQLEYFNQEMTSRDPSYFQSPDVNTAMSKMDKYEGSGIAGSTSLAEQYALGTPTNTATMPGFSNPNTGGGPGQTVSDTGKPDVVAAARGANVLKDPNDSTDVSQQSLNPMVDLAGMATGGIGGFPGPGGQEPWAEPLSGLAITSHDMVSVFATKAHPSAIVVNDVSGAETILLHHGKSGSKIEMGHDGTDVYRSRGDAYHVSGGDTYHGSSRDLNISAKHAVNITAQEANIQTDGSVMIVSMNDGAIHVAGKFDVMCGETTQFKATRVIFEAQNMDFYTTQNMRFFAEGSMYLRAKNFAQETTGDMNIKSGGAYSLESVKDMNVYSAGKFNAYSSSDTNLKAGGTTHINASSDVDILAGSALHLEGSSDLSIANDSSPIKMYPSSVLIKESAPAATQASQTKKITDPMDQAQVVAPKAKSTNLGKPSEKTSVQQPKVQDDTGSSLIASSDAAYTPSTGSV